MSVGPIDGVDPKVNIWPKEQNGPHEPRPQRVKTTSVWMKDLWSFYKIYEKSHYLMRSNENEYNLKNVLVQK